MLRTTFVGLVVAVLGCTSVDSQPASARRDAMGAPSLVWRPQATATPRMRATTGVLPLPDRALVFDGEPWVVLLDGGAAELVDVVPGPLPAWDGTNATASWADRAYFTASSSTLRRGVVWESDGTLAGTRALSLTDDLNVIDLQSSPWGLVVGGLDQATRHARLWLDGGSVVPLGNFDLRTPLRDFTEVNGRLLFFHQNSALYGTSGSDAGAVGLFPSSTGEPKHLVASANAAWFPGNGRLWRSDGTPAGTVFSGLGLTAVTDVSVWRSSLVVVGEAQNELSVWQSDGTDAGTSALMQLGSTGRAYLVAAGPTHLYLNTSVNSVGSFVAIDGTDAGIAMLGSVPAAAPTLLLGDTLLFTRSSEPWRTDGTTTGTQALAPGVTVRDAFIPLGGVAVFVGATNASGAEPWVTDGTVAGTRPLAELSPGSGDGVNGTLRSDGRHAWFACQVPGRASAVCVTDGTPAGTRVVSPAPTSANPSTVVWARGVAGRVLLRHGTRFAVYSPGAGVEDFRPLSVTPPVVSPDQTTAWFISQGALWKTDGTDAGTFSVGARSFPDDSTLLPRDEVVWVRSGNGLVRYRSDAGFETPLQGLTPPTVGFQFRDLTPVGDELAFWANVNGAFDLLLTGAADGGVRTLAGAYSALPQPTLAYWNGALYFPGGTGLMRFTPADGGSALAVTGLSATLRPTPNTLYAASLINHGWYRTDGTDAGTERLASFSPSINGIDVVPEFVAASQGALFLVVPRDVRGNSTSTVWWTDGTSAATAPAPLRTEAQDAFGTAFDTTQTLRGALHLPGFGIYLPVWTPETGLEPGLFDPGTGTASVLFDLWPGPRTSSPRDPVLMGNQLHFLADDGAGQGLFVIDLLGTMPVDAGSGGGGGGAATGGGSAATGGGSGATGGGAASTGGGEASGGGAAEGGGGGGEAKPPGCGCQPTSLNAAWLLMALALRRRRNRPPPGARDSA